MAHTVHSGTKTKAICADFFVVIALHHLLLHLLFALLVYNSCHTVQRLAVLRYFICCLACKLCAVGMTTSVSVCPLCPWLVFSSGSATASASAAPPPAACLVRLCGALRDSSSMHKYTSWQKAVEKAEELSRGRYRAGQAKTSVQCAMPKGVKTTSTTTTKLATSSVTAKRQGGRESE